MSFKQSSPVKTEVGAMTLNITVAARWLMAQSSDFRLTTQAGVAVSESAQKQVVIQYRNWSGLLCYTGVAKWKSHDTATWLGTALTHKLGERSPNDVIGQILDEGSSWLGSVPLTHRRHTFTMITYERAKPNVYVISNFERPNGKSLTTPADSLFCTRVRPRGPRCIVTGYSPAVSQQQSNALKDLLATGPEPEMLRDAVALASRESSSRARGTVGEQCVVAHLCPDGSGEAHVYGNLSAEFLPAMIKSGLNLLPDVQTALGQAGVVGPQRLVGVTWTASEKDVSVMLPAFRSLPNQTGSGWPGE
ncbi:hypothetical protein ACGFY7_49330 [Streptomyces prunicolor]|uniref:hypothetical protein n=1 Tax=Streptomyces prunicolor TaxID=67348 RepID=UPI00371C5533